MRQIQDAPWNKRERPSVVGPEKESFMKKILIAACCAALVSTAASAQMVTGPTEGMTNSATNSGESTKQAKAVPAKMAKKKAGTSTKSTN